MSESEVITQDATSGKFLANNTWRYRPGISGHPARFNYRSMRLKVIDYITEQLITEKRYTWAGLAQYLGISRSGLDMYRDGTLVNIRSKDKTAIRSLLSYYITNMESQLEERLTDRKFATNGVIKALQAIDNDKWGDNKKIDIDIKQQVSIALDPESNLSKRLGSAGVTITQPSITPELPSS